MDVGFWVLGSGDLGSEFWVFGFWFFWLWALGFELRVQGVESCWPIPLA